MKLFILMLSLAITAGAQTSSGTGAVQGLTFSSSGTSGRAVTGMPYSAQEATERVQTLADGTRITQPSQQVMFYRDSLGRTRTERSLAPPPGATAAGIAGPAFIDIADPVKGTHYTLDPRSHVARQISAPPPPPPPPASAAAMNRVPAFSAPAAAQRQRPESSRESLGTQTIEGVLAEGQRRTMVYPVGFFGNDRPITTVSEIWTSPDLKIVVLSKNSDPRSGESTTRLTNISRGEPDPSLFQVPADYEIVSSNR